MKPTLKLAAYGVALVVMVGAGALVGSATGPIEVAGDAPHGGGDAAGGGHGDTSSDGEAETPSPTAPASGSTGLAVSEAGYTLVTDDRLADEGPLSFTITGPDRRPVEDFEVVHERPMHLIVASRDLLHFAHVHPELGDGGRWTVDLPALPPGPYRAFADFRPAGGPALTLGIDLLNPGAATAPRPLEPTTVSTTGGYDVTVGGTLTPGVESVLEVTVRRDGEAVTTDPYLGAGGHLVALRDGDLAYLHVHPLDAEPSSPVRFAVEVPSPGTYALFFDFLHDGQVRTARFVLDASTAAEAPPAPAADHGDHTH